MEREQYRRMRAVLRAVERDHHDNPRYTHRDSTVLLTALWAALHNKPACWATKPEHWPGDLRPRGGLPSQPTMSRRLRLPCGADADPAANADDCRATIFDLLERWQAALRRQLPDSDVKLIDGRGLVIGGCSKDPDAGFGFTAGTKAKGYKLHWVVDRVSGAVDGWLVAPMNFPEPEAARRLIDHLPPHVRYVLADGNYDGNPLYEQAGHDRGVQWVAPPRWRDAKGLGHRQHSDWRLAVQRWLRSDEGRRAAATARIPIEQVNGRVGCAAVGLNHLPYHARRLHRVTVWVGLKLLILTDLQAQTFASACA